MSTFSYQGGTHNFPGGSGVFICSTSAVGGAGSQSNGCLLVYRATKALAYQRDSVVWLPLGRSAPVTEIGQYNYRTMEVAAAWPGTGVDLDGSSSVSGATIESRITAIVAALQSGNFVDYQDGRGRRLYGTFAADPKITDETVLWRSVTFTVTEIASG